MAITHDNHYLPQLYLKHFSSVDQQLYRYRLLVPSTKVPEWKPVRPRAVGYGVHLYTRALPGGDSDEIEQWLNRDFETPAAPSLQKAVNDERLHKEDYRLLVRFLASQVVRTPAFFIRNRARWEREAEEQMKDTERNLLGRLEEAKRTGVPPKSGRPIANAKYLPYRVVQEPSTDGLFVNVRTETVVGRGTWVFAMRHLLTDTLERLVEHRWTIIRAHDRLPWFTSDDPVLRLNFNSPQNYDFGGGWGVENTNIMLPLSPRHLLFTQVGDRKPPQRGTTFNEQVSLLLRKYLAENAHRNIFASTRDSDVQRLRPRTVDSERFNAESALWKGWHGEQSAAERELLKG